MRLAAHLVAVHPDGTSARECREVEASGRNYFLRIQAAAQRHFPPARPAPVWGRASAPASAAGSAARSADGYDDEGEEDEAGDGREPPRYDGAIDPLPRYAPPSSPDYASGDGVIEEASTAKGGAGRQAAGWDGIVYLVWLHGDCCYRRDILGVWLVDLDAPWSVACVCAGLPDVCWVSGTYCASDNHH